MKIVPSEKDSGSKLAKPAPKRTAKASGDSSSQASPTPKSRGQKKPSRKEVRVLQGRRYIKRLEKHLYALRLANPHHNRRLGFDDITVILLLGFFNEHIRSLRSLDAYSQVPGVRQHLGVRRVCRSTLSDALKLFDPELLKPIVNELFEALPKKSGLQPDFEKLLNDVIAFDGSYFRVPAKVAWALQERTVTGVEGRQVRLNLHLCLGNGNPTGISISGEDGPTEAEAVLKDVSSGNIYIGDRGIFSYAGVEGIVKAKSHFVFRLIRTVNFVSQQERRLKAQDVEHRVESDRLGRLKGSNRHSPPDVPVREIIITHPEEPGERIRLLTDMLDVPAHVIGLLYLQRMRIEMFFRWLKVYARFEHMISHSENGVEAWFYIAFIGTLLTSLYTGHEPSVYSFFAAQMIISGAATYEDMAPQLERFARERAQARARYAAKRAAQKNA